MPFITASLAVGLTALTAAIAPAAVAGGTAAGGIAAAGLGGAAAAGAAGAGAAAGAAGAGLGISAAGITGALGALGTVGGLASTYMQTQSNMEMAQASQEAEKLRQQQAALISSRERRDAIRQAQAAKATGLNSIAGATGEVNPLVSSAYGGLTGQTTGNLAYQTSAINQNESIGQGIFAANAASSQAQGNAAFYKGTGALFAQLADPATAAAGGRLGKTIFDRI